jgi:hypothetical protein
MKAEIQPRAAKHPAAPQRSRLLPFWGRDVGPRYAVRRGSKLKELARGDPWTPCPSACASGKTRGGVRYACPGNPYPPALAIARARTLLLCGLRPEQQRTQSHEPDL